jgi:hypothetical protein
MNCTYHVNQASINSTFLSEKNITSRTFYYLMIKQTTSTTIFITTTAIATIIFLGLIPQIHAQQPQQNITDFTKYFAETTDTDFRHCNNENPNSCFHIIDVLYQDNSTIALKSSYIDSIWKAVSAVKKDGYKIDGFTTFAESQEINTVVVMSK